ncbi:hypothetical protein RUND412_011223 [Rhizina undulata]
MAHFQLHSNHTAPPLPSSPSAYIHPYPPYFVQPPPLMIFSLMLLTPLMYFTYKDYKGYLSLGPGGTPSNFYGYLKISFLRIFALRNPCQPGSVPVELQDTGFLPPSGLPKRSSPRPVVAGIAPHRQLNQRPTKEVFNHLSKRLRKVADEYPKRLKIAKSCFEKHCPGLFSTKQINKTCNGEIAHAHPSDGSLHMTLHPADAKVIIEAGWGERHPLARGGWCSRFVPVGFLMIYAPRTEEEVEIVMEIVNAGIGWVSGEQLDGVELVEQVLQQ